MELEGKIVCRKRLTLGSDPEMFVFASGKLLPAFEFLPAKNTGKNMYWDGFQAEWKYDFRGNHCQNNLVFHTRESLQVLETEARLKNEKATLSLVNVVRIPDVILESVRDEFVELGCEPSYNIYGLRPTPVGNPRKLKYRFAGGHMHFGEWVGTIPPYERIVKTLDALLGVWSVGVARHIDTPIRRKYYGLPGEYRKPSYGINSHGKRVRGIEYRVLTNWWLAAPCTLQLTWDIGRMSVWLASSKYRQLWAASEDEVKDTIANSDWKQAERILRRNESMFQWMLKQRYESPKAIRMAKVISFEGLHSVIPDPDNFHSNWHFADEWIPDGGQPWAKWSTYTEGLK